MVSIRTLTLSVVVLVLVIAAPASAGNGGFAAGAKLGMSLPQSVAIADFNGDGRPDIASPSYNENLIHVHLAKTGGGFTRAPDVIGGLGPVSLVAADFNRDGNEDLAVTDPDGKKVTVRLGKTGGGFTDAPDIDLTQGPYALVVGDFNSDGRNDLAVSDYAPAGGHLHIELGAGDGKFTEAGTPLEITAAVLTVGDFNNDGVEDLAFARFGAEPAGFVKGEGGGAFGQPDDIPLPGTARGLAVGDFNADGIEDLAVAIRDKGLVSIVFGDGGGVFDDTPLAVRAGKETYAVAVGDFNSDGREDVAATNLTDRAVSVLLNRGDGTFARTSVGTGTNPVDVAVADLDGDGNDDLAVASSAGNGGIEIKRGLGTPLLAGNLLTNGGFEGAGASAVTDAAPPIPGWQRTGGMTFARYGSGSHAYFPSFVAAARHGAAGASFLWGGYGGATDGVTTASQIVDVAKRAAQIDAGRGRAHFSAYLGGSLGFLDAMTARAQFVGKGGATLGTLKLGPVTKAARSGLTKLVRRAGATQLPRGTRRIRVTLTSIDDDKSYSSAVADNVKLTVDARAAFRRDAMVAFAGILRVHTDDPARVLATNGNPFPVTGQLTARTVKRLGPQHKQLGLGSAPLGIPAGGARTVRFPLPPAASAEMVNRHHLDLRVKSVVHDAAGHTRTVGATVRIEQAA
jgi:hypothetical protein